MKELTKTILTDVHEDEIYEAIFKLAERFACYDGDPVDDIQEYHHEEYGKDNRLIYIMTPVGEYLFFRVKRKTSKQNEYYVEYLGSNWGNCKKVKD